MNKTNRLINTENWWLQWKMGGQRDELGEGDKDVQTSNYEINQSWDESTAQGI